nr:hypothetical protein [Ancylobacter gelatini]
MIGFEPDRKLAAMIEDETGIACATTALATVDFLRSRNLRRIGLLAQGDEDDGMRLRHSFAREGIEIVVAHNLGITDNFEAARVTPEQIEDHALRLAAETDLDAVLIWSTNLAGHGATARLRHRLAIPVLDSAALGILNTLPSVAAPPLPLPGVA